MKVNDLHVMKVNVLHVMKVNVLHVMKVNVLHVMIYMYDDTLLLCLEYRSLTKRTAQLLKRNFKKLRFINNVCSDQSNKFTHVCV